MVNKYHFLIFLAIYYAGCYTISVHAAPAPAPDGEPVTAPEASPPETPSPETPAPETPAPETVPQETLPPEAPAPGATAETPPPESSPPDTPSATPEEKPESNELDLDAFTLKRNSFIDPFGYLSFINPDGSVGNDHQVPDTCYNNGTCVKGNSTGKPGSHAFGMPAPIKAVQNKINEQAKKINDIPIVSKYVGYGDKDKEKYFGFKLPSWMTGQGNIKDDLGSVSFMKGAFTFNFTFMKTGFGFLLNPRRRDFEDYYVEGGDMAEPREPEDNNQTSGKPGSAGPQPGRVTQTTLNIDSILWDPSAVPYKFHNSTNKVKHDLFVEAMRLWEAHTCVRFKEMTNEKQHLRLRTDLAGCHSFAGKMDKRFVKGDGGQDVNLGDGCDLVTIALHELGHALGLFHEQARLDRDKYIKINYNNIVSQYYPQFDKRKTTNELEEYDYKSVMQYPSWGFSVEPWSKITMSTINPMYQYMIDEERRGLSFRDIKLMNRLYKCEKYCTKADPCKNGGYRIPFRRKTSMVSDCPCICSPGYGGNLCEKVYFDATKADHGLRYYGGLRCGGNITQETTIRTPGYPKRQLTKPGCSWWIVAPKGKAISVKFKDFSFLPPESYMGNKCVYEKVELRSRDLSDPVSFCGEQLKGQTVNSDAPSIVIVIVPDIHEGNPLEGRGLEAEIKFVEPKKKTTPAPKK